MDLLIDPHWIQLKFGNAKFNCLIAGPSDFVCDYRFRMSCLWHDSKCLTKPMSMCQLTEIQKAFQLAFEEFSNEQ